MAKVVGKAEVVSPHPYHRPMWMQMPQEVLSAAGAVSVGYQTAGRTQRSRWRAAADHRFSGGKQFAVPPGDVLNINPDRKTVMVPMRPKQGRSEKSAGMLGADDQINLMRVFLFWQPGIFQAFQPDPSVFGVVVGTGKLPAHGRD